MSYEDRPEFESLFLLWVILWWCLRLDHPVVRLVSDTFRCVLLVRLLLDRRLLPLEPESDSMLYLERGRLP